MFGGPRALLDTAAEAPPIAEAMKLTSICDCSGALATYGPVWRAGKKTPQTLYRRTGSPVDRLGQSDRFVVGAVRGWIFSQPPRSARVRIGPV